MSLTVRIVWQYILSRVCVSVWPSIFFRCEKHSKPRRNRATSASVYFNGQRPAIVTSGAGRHGWLVQTHRIAIRRWRCVCVGGVCVCTCSRGCVRTCARPFVRAWCVCNNFIWPRLIIIIIKNIILYFIQIRHTDDFPSTGTHLVLTLFVALPCFRKIQLMEYAPHYKG